jgi:DNA-binding NarL/FixJ family response regulator
MSIPISSALSIVATAISPQNTNQAVQNLQPQPQETEQATNTSGYTVQLSEAQQVYQLYNQGQQVPQIATALNLSVTAVNNYLGITTPSNNSSIG